MALERLKLKFAAMSDDELRQEQRKRYADFRDADKVLDTEDDYQRSAQAHDIWVLTMDELEKRGLVDGNIILSERKQTD